MYVCVCVCMCVYVYVYVCVCQCQHQTPFTIHHPFVCMMCYLWVALTTVLYMSVFVGVYITSFVKTL